MTGDKGPSVPRRRSRPPARPCVLRARVRGRTLAAVGTTRVLSCSEQLPPTTAASSRGAPSVRRRRGARNRRRARPRDPPGAEVAGRIDGAVVRRASTAGADAARSGGAAASWNTSSPVRPRKPMHLSPGARAGAAGSSASRRPDGRSRNLLPAPSSAQRRQPPTAFQPVAAEHGVRDGDHRSAERGEEVVAVVPAVRDVAAEAAVGCRPSRRRGRPGSRRCGRPSRGVTFRTGLVFFFALWASCLPGSSSSPQRDGRMAPAARGRAPASAARARRVPAASSSLAGSAAAASSGVAPKPVGRDGARGQLVARLEQVQGERGLDMGPPGRPRSGGDSPRPRPTRRGRARPGSRRRGGRRRSRARRSHPDRGGRDGAPEERERAHRDPARPAGGAGDVDALEADDRGGSRVRARAEAAGTRRRVGFVAAPGATMATAPAAAQSGESCAAATGA